MTKVEMEQEVEIGVDMGKAIYSMLENLDKDENLKKFIYSVCESFKNNVKEDISRDEQILLGIITGWIVNNIYNNTCEKIDFDLFKPRLTEILENGENLFDYEAKLEDGNSFVITTNNEDVSNEQLKEIVEKQTGKKVVSEFKKLSKEEGKEMHDKVIQQLKEEGNKEDEI